MARSRLMLLDNLELRPPAHLLRGAESEGGLLIIAHVVKPEATTVSSLPPEITKYRAEQLLWIHVCETTS